jgi:uncharacterized damage-inducible protein DinB
MEVDEVFDKIADSRQNLLAAISGLDKETISNAKIDKNWTIKDALAHIIAWDEVCLEPLRNFSRGEAFNVEPIKDHDSWNAQQLARRSGQPLDTILRDLTRVRLELLSVAQRLDDYHWKMELSLPWGNRGTVINMLSSLAWHEEEHTKDILKWKDGNPT